jgi:hypothetical protein
LAAGSSRKPLLASEVLLDDAAPLRPWPKLPRILALILAAQLVLLGLAAGPALGLSVAASPLAYAAAATCALLAVLPFPYAARAALLAGIATALLALGIVGEGPLAAVTNLERALVPSPPFWLLALPAITTLLVRARYATYPPARAWLAVALLLALPLLWLSVRSVLDDALPWPERWAAGAVAIALLCSPSGLFGDGALGSVSPWAWSLLVVLPLERAAGTLPAEGGAGIEGLAALATGVGVGLALALVSMALAQLVAVLVAPRARDRLRKARPTGERRLNDRTP